MSNKVPPWVDDPCDDELFVHFLKDGIPSMQGITAGRSHGRIKIQMYSALDGCATNIILVDENDLFSNHEKYRLYNSESQWRSEFSSSFEKWGRA